MQQPLLVQPHAAGRLSGGYLYNRRMADAGLWQLADVEPNALAGFAERLGTPRTLLMDSIWLRPEYLPTFLSLQTRGHRLGLMLHSFPSMIDATEGGRPPLAQPSAFEVNAIGQLAAVLVPGRHYQGLLSGVRTPIVVLEPGIDDAWRAAPRRRVGPCRMVSVGAVTPRKGFLDVVDALARRVSAPGGSSDFVWSAIGSLDVDPAYAARVQQRARSLPGVSLHGQLSPERTRDLVQQADLFLMPSYDENQPLVLLEAMAASVPAVAYAAGATRFMIEHGREGLVAEIGDTAALAAYIAQLLDDEPARYQMAVSCWARQRTLASWSERAERARGDLKAAFGE